MKRNTYVTNIEYDLSREELENRVKYLLNDYPEKLSFMLGKHFSNIEDYSASTLSDVIEQKIENHIVNTSNFLGLDSFMKLPNDIEKDDYEKIEEYISAQTGYFVNSYEVRG